MRVGSQRGIWNVGADLQWISLDSYLGLNWESRYPKVGLTLDEMTCATLLAGTKSGMQYTFTVSGRRLR
jgi:hypothetical protein